MSYLWKFQTKTLYPLVYTFLWSKYLNNYFGPETSLLAYNCFYPITTDDFSKGFPAWHRYVPGYCVQVVASLWLNIHYSPFSNHIFRIVLAIKLCFTSLLWLFPSSRILWWYIWVHLDTLTLCQKRICQAMDDFH